MKVHYGGQKILSQILFFKQVSTSTKPILKDVFINNIQNKVVQFPKYNAIIKGNIK